jgi:hypothetical protein
LSAAPRSPSPALNARNPAFVPAVRTGNVNGCQGAIKAAQGAIRREALTFSRAIGRFLLKFVMEAQPFGRIGVSESHPVG